jgi:hypothetical protein
MKQAVIYERKGVLYIRTSSQTKDGVWIDEGPCLSVPTSGSPEEIGTAVKQALDSSRFGIPHPTSWNTINDELLREAGVKSWSTFGKTAKCLNVEFEGNIRISPTRNGGNREGFIVIMDKVRTVPSTTPTDVGEGVKLSLEHCE